MKDSTCAAAPSFDADGYTVLENVLTGQECDDAGKVVVDVAGKSGGSRNLLDFDWCVRIATKLQDDPRIARLLPSDAVPVQCTYFRKSLSTNWLVPVHQDLSIPVREEVNAPELKGWSIKEGQLYVQAPQSVLQSLVAVRVHIDPCGAADGPLRVLPGTHRLGRLEQSRVAEVAGDSEEVVCLVPKGGCLAMRPLLLHASSKATGSSARRVLHFVFGPKALPYGLRWRHG